MVRGKGEGRVGFAGGEDLMQALPAVWPGGLVLCLSNVNFYTLSGFLECSVFLN